MVLQSSMIVSAASFGVECVRPRWPRRGRGFRATRQLTVCCRTRDESRRAVFYRAAPGAADSAPTTGDRVGAGQRSLPREHVRVARASTDGEGVGSPKLSGQVPPGPDIEAAQPLAGGIPLCEGWFSPGRGMSARSGCALKSLLLRLAGRQESGQQVALEDCLSMGEEVST